MTTRDREALAIVLVGTAAPAIGRFLWMLQDTLQQTERVLAAARERLLAVFGAMSLDDFHRLRLRPRPQYDFSPEWCAYHLVKHEVEHRGEIGTVRLLAEAALGVGTT